MSDWTDIVFNPIVIGIGILGFIVLCCCVAYQDQKDWDQYSKLHHCIVVSETSATVSTGLVNGKIATMTTPGTKTYRCDDGILHTR